MEWIPAGIMISVILAFGGWMFWLVRDLRADMRQQYQELRADMRQQYQELREDMRQQNQELREEMNRQNQELRADMRQQHQDLLVVLQGHTHSEEGDAVFHQLTAFD